MLLLTVIMVVQLCICGKIGVNQMDVWTMQNVYTAITDPKKFPTWQSTGAFPQHYKQSLFIKRFQVPFRHVYLVHLMDPQSILSKQICFL